MQQLEPTTQYKTPVTFSTTNPLLQLTSKFIAIFSEKFHVLSENKNKVNISKQKKTGKEKKRIKLI